VPRFLESFAYQYNRHIGVPHIEPGVECYRIEMDMGLRIDVENEDVNRRFDMRFHAEPLDAPPPPAEPDTVPVPPFSEWANIRELGAAGDGVTDDTEAFERAIAQHRAVYLPQGLYLVTRGLELRKDTALIGLHCSKTRLILQDGAAGFGDGNAPAAMVTIPKGGHNSVSGICLEGGRNKGVTQVLWLGAPDSLMEDCLFDFGGHGGAVKGRDRAHAIFVKDEGAGVFKNIWIPDVWTKDGFHISDTSSPGQIWMVSVEHHLDIEVVLERVANWKIAALQTEENLGSEYAASLRLEDCRDVEFVNLFQYRVQAIDIQHPYAADIRNCKNLTIHGIHCFSIGPTPFTNAARIDGSLLIKDLEIGTLHVNC